MPQCKRKHGERPNSKTSKANSLVYVVAALVHVAVARRAHYILEQPIGSRMLLIASLSKATRPTQAQTIVTYLL